MTDKTGIIFSSHSLQHMLLSRTGFGRELILAVSLWVIISASMSPFISFHSHCEIKDFFFFFSFWRQDYGRKRRIRSEVWGRWQAEGLPKTSKISLSSWQPAPPTGNTKPAPQGLALALRWPSLPLSEHSLSLIAVGMYQFHGSSRPSLPWFNPKSPTKHLASSD